MNSRRVWYSMAMCTSVLICASPTWAGLGLLPFTHSHSAACLPVCAWILEEVDGYTMHNQSATHPQPCHSYIHHPWESSSNPKVCIIMRQCPTPLFGKTTTITPVCSASICKLSPLLSTFVPFFLTLLPYSLIRNHHSIYLLALMATHGLFFFYPFLSYLLAYYHYFLIPFAVLRSLPSFVFIGNGGVEKQ